MTQYAVKYGGSTVEIYDTEEEAEETKRELRRDGKLKKELLEVVKV